MISIRDFKGEIEQIILQLQKLTSEFSVNDELSSMIKQIQEELNRRVPSLMFYGVYNSGKSSLLNAIAGDNIAKVGDVPTTNQVLTYRWKNFDLVDTPGINGPIRDYQISKSELTKHDIVLFVIDDSDTFDSKIVAEEIVSIIEMKKPLIIFLNAKQGGDSEKVDRIRLKLSENIVKAAKCKGMDENVVYQQYEFITGKAKTAFKAKVENKNKLLQSSNIQIVEKCITQKLEEIDSIKLLLVPLSSLSIYLDKLEEELSNQLQGEDKDDLINLINQLSELKLKSIGHLRMLIRLEIRKYSNLMNDLIQQGKSINHLQEELSDKINKSISNHVNQLISQSATDIKIWLEQVNTNFEVKSVEGLGTIDSKVELSDVEIPNSAVEDILNVLSNIPIMLPTPTPIPLPNIFLQILASFSKERRKDRYQEAVQRNHELNLKIEEDFNRRMNALQEARSQLNMHLHTFEEEANKIAENNVEQAYSQCSKVVQQLLVDAEESTRSFNKVSGELLNHKEAIEKIKVNISA